MAYLPPSQQIGDNLYAENNGRYYTVTQGTYKDANGKTVKGGVRTYVANPYDTMSGKLNSLYDAQKKQAVANLDLQRKALAPQYQAQRNQADVTNAQNVQKLRELMAANGINASGENVTAQANLAGQRQSALNQINTDQQDALNKITMQSNDQVNGIEAQRAQALANAYNQFQTQTDAKAADWRNYQNQLAQQNWQKYQFNNLSASQQAQDAWNKYVYNNLSADQKSAFAMNKYNTDTTNAANSAAANAELAYYKNLGFNPDTKGGGTSAKGMDAFKTNLAAANKMGVPASSNAALAWLVDHESSFNPTAKNPTSTAYGYGQFLTSTRRQYEKETGLSYDNPVNQIYMMYQYVKDRYGSPENAVAFWQKNHWY